MIFGERMALTNSVSGNNLEKLSLFAERSTMTRFADLVGYIPVVGSVIGVMRITAASVAYLVSFVALKYFTSLQDKDPDKQTGLNRWAFVKADSLSELYRGFVELLPFLSYKRDQMCKENDKTIWAHGRYIHCNANGDLFFSYGKQIIQTEAAVPFENENSGQNIIKGNLNKQITTDILNKPQDIIKLDELPADSQKTSLEEEAMPSFSNSGKSKDSSGKEVLNDVQPPPLNQGKIARKDPNSNPQNINSVTTSELKKDPPDTQRKNPATFQNIKKDISTIDTKNTKDKPVSEESLLIPRIDLLENEEGQSEQSDQLKQPIELKPESFKFSSWNININSEPEKEAKKYLKDDDHISTEELTCFLKAAERALDEDDGNGYAVLEKIIYSAIDAKCYNIAKLMINRLDYSFDPWEISEGAFTARFVQQASSDKQYKLAFDVAYTYIAQEKDHRESEYANLVLLVNPQYRRDLVQILRKNGKPLTTLLTAACNNADLSFLLQLIEEQERVTEFIFKSICFDGRISKVELTSILRVMLAKQAHNVVGYMRMVIDEAHMKGDEELAEVLQYQLACAESSSNILKSIPVQKRFDTIYKQVKITPSPLLLDLLAEGAVLSESEFNLDAFEYLLQESTLMNSDSQRSALLQIKIPDSELENAVKVILKYPHAACLIERILQNKAAINKEYIYQLFIFALENNNEFLMNLIIDGYNFDLDEGVWQKICKINKKSIIERVANNKSNIEFKPIVIVLIPLALKMGSKNIIEFIKQKWGMKLPAECSEYSIPWKIATGHLQEAYDAILEQDKQNHSDDQLTTLLLWCEKNGFLACLAALYQDKDKKIDCRTLTLLLEKAEGQSIIQQMVKFNANIYFLPSMETISIEERTLLAEIFILNPDVFNKYPEEKVVKAFKRMFDYYALYNLSLQNKDIRKEILFKLNELKTPSALNAFIQQQHWELEYEINQKNYYNDVFNKIYVTHEIIKNKPELAALACAKSSAIPLFDFLTPDFKKGDGVDAGGLRRQFFSDLFASWLGSSSQDRMISWNGDLPCYRQKLPLRARTQKKVSETSLDSKSLFASGLLLDEQDRLFTSLGRLLGMCYASNADGSGNVLIGRIFPSRYFALLKELMHVIDSGLNKFPTESNPDSKSINSLLEICLKFFEGDKGIEKFRIAQKGSSTNLDNLKYYFLNYEKCNLNSEQLKLSTNLKDLLKWHSVSFKQMCIKEQLDEYTYVKQGCENDLNSLLEAAGLSKKYTAEKLFCHIRKSDDEGPKKQDNSLLVDVIDQLLRNKNLPFQDVLNLTINLSILEKCAYQPNDLHRALDKLIQWVEDNKNQPKESLQKDILHNFWRNTPRIRILQAAFLIAQGISEMVNPLDFGEDADTRIQGLAFDREYIVSLVRPASNLSEMTPSVVQQYHWLIEFIKNAEQTKVENLLWSITGSRTVGRETAIIVASHYQPNKYCVAHTCFRQIDFSDNPNMTHEKFLDMLEEFMGQQTMTMA